ncbi:MAG: hypothetical protein OEZ36_08225, partial [Spirochaetota bacterium]|nr:hypothetical protein [Spirochaetota bacterium]
MKDKNVPLRICVIIFILITSVFIFDRASHSYALYSSTGLGGLSDYLYGGLYFLLINIWPFLLSLLVLIYYKLKPVQIALNDLVSGKQPDEKLLNKARNVLVSLPKILFVINLIGFLVGDIFYIYMYEVTQSFGPAYIGAILIYIIAVAIMVTFMEIGIINVLLNRSRELFNIHFIDNDSYKKQLGIMSKGKFLMISVLIYILSLFSVQSFHRFILESRYSGALEVYSDKTIANYEKDKTIDNYKGFVIQLNSIYIKGIRPDQVSFPRSLTVSGKVNSYFSHFYLFLLSFVLLTYIVQHLNYKDLSGRIRLLRQRIQEILRGGGDL